MTRLHDPFEDHAARIAARARETEGVMQPTPPIVDLATAKAVSGENVKVSLVVNGRTQHFLMHRETAASFISYLAKSLA
ncbi:hypothetical protein [Nitratireductor soli]|uniref:hypothetical protein n=1 Tax=Nitratireductor soli TaxID=1670619 RepID=UPI00065E3F38|nr:hypothetical protein [Nitratireductor soli]